jgi:hypothetical protein
VCAIIELRLLGVAVSDQRLAQAKATEDEKARQRAARKHEQDTAREWPDSDEYFAYIAGYTSGGMPYGVRWEELEPAELLDSQADLADLDDRVR